MSGLEGVRGLVEEIAHQKPEKPDYWNSCSQCERNIDAAQEALAAPPPAAARGDVRIIARDIHYAIMDDGLAPLSNADNHKVREAILRVLQAALAAEGVQAGEVDGEALARRFHETYERLAPSFGYETRTETRKFDPESANGRLMIAVCAELSQQPEARGVVDEAMVERAYQAWRKAAVAREGNKPAIRAALTAAITEARNVR